MALEGFPVEHMQNLFFLGVPSHVSEWQNENDESCGRYKMKGEREGTN